MIELKLKVDQVELILAALAKQPFEIVASLIGEVRQQALPQIPSAPSPTTDDSNG